MITVDDGLEKKIEPENRPCFKSEGERRIANFLDKNSIRYQYERGLLLNPSDGRQRIWYPYVELEIM
jgi:hypothetical protein